MLKNKFLFYFFLITATVWIYSLNSFAADNATAQLTQLLSNFTSMSADFTQSLYDRSGNVIQKSTGTMALQRPGEFRWQVTSPNNQVLIADGKYLWVYDIDLEQATRQTLDEKNANSPASLLSGSITSLQNRFYVTRINKNQTGDWFKLKPKAQSDLFKWIQFHFINGQLAEMHLYDNLGQLSSFTFTHVKINPKLASSLFTFAAPKGVDVIIN